MAPASGRRRHPRRRTGGGTGPQNQTGPTEPRGATGATAPGKPKARAARVELVTCATGTAKGKTRKHCTTKLLKHAVAINANGKRARASLKRAGKLYATGRLTRTHGSLRLVLDILERKPLPPGAYTLILTWKAGKATHTSQQPSR